MELITPETLEKTLKEVANGDFSGIIDNLPLGGALRLHSSEWKRREPCNHYYWRKYRGKISVKRINGYYYLIRKQ